MISQKKKEIINLLKKNGFERMDENNYANDKCGVDLSNEYISIANNYGDNDIIPFDIFAVIGVLIYRKYIERIK